MPLHNMTNMYLKVIYGDYQPALQCDTNLTSANTATITNYFDIELQFMPKSFVLKPLSIKAMSFSSGGKGVIASGGTGRYNWLAHVEAVGSHCG